MRLLAATVALPILVAAAPAHADGYIGAAIGTGPSLGNNQFTAEQAGRTYRALLGYSFQLPFGRLSLEGEANRFNLALDSYPYHSTMLGAGLKYSVPIGNGFEVFGRGGYGHTWVGDDDPSAPGANGDGDGYYLGAGFEYRLSICSFFVDYERQSVAIQTLESGIYDQSAGSFGLGATLSL